MSQAIPTLAVLLFVAGGFSIILGGRRLGGWLIGGAIALVLVAPFIGPAAAAAPALVWIVLFFGLSVAALRLILTFSIGRRGASEALGILASDFIRFLVLAPFRFISFLLGRQRP